ncbi:hypothetical protein [Streptomyces sp. KL116D]|uniref:hypothetical protein n=1 Tax=Streptomyces sp. KL116D TaxID=3045152 RepID=UPI003558EA98
MANFSDDFARADSTDLGAGWVEVSGDWSIVNGQLSPGSNTGTIIVRAAATVDTSDNYAQVTVSVPSAGASQGVWCRGTASLSSGYLWRSNGSSWDLFAVTGGSFNVIGTYTADLAAGDTARVQAVGSTIKGFVNGVQRVSVTDTSVTAGTYVGLRSDSVSTIRYDAFIGADVVAGAALTAAAATEFAQPLVGAKAANSGAAVASETAQSLPGAKAVALAVAATPETAQPLAGGKTTALGVALESLAAQTIGSTKTAPLSVVVEADAAEPFAAAVIRTINAAFGIEAALPLAGGKRAALTPALEVSISRPVSTGSPEMDFDIDVTVGAPQRAPYTAGAPQAGDWKVGAPW